MYRLLLNDSSPDNLWGCTQALIGLAMLHTDRAQHDSCELLLERAGQNLDNLHDTIILTKYHLAKGYLSNNLGNYDEARNHYSEGLHLAKLSRNVENQHAFRLNLGQVHLETGNYAQAAKILTEELKFADSSGNEFNQSLALKSLANVAHSANNQPDAIALSKRSLQILKRLRISDEYANQLINLGIYYKDAEMPDSAMMAYREAFNLMAERDDSVKMMMIRFNMSNILKNQGKYKEAENEMEQVIRFCRQHDITEGRIYALSSLSKIYKETGRLKQSIASIDSALALAIRQNLVTALSQIYNSQHEILAAMGKYQKAYESSLKSHLLADSLLNIEKQKDISNLKIKYETERKEVENTILKKDIEIQKSQLWVFRIIIILGFLLLVFIIVGFYLWRKKIKQAEQLSLERLNVLKLESRQKIIELEKAALENQVKEEALTKANLENQLKEEQIGKLELQSGLKEQELIYQSLARAELVQILNSMHENLLPFKLKLQRKKDQNDFDQMLGNIIHERNKDPLSEFEILFRELHPKFYETLLAQNPTLTKSEIQICAMIRLNLSSKDIARLINLNQTSIDTTRYHIRQKLKLDPKDNLTSHLMTM